MSKAKLIGLGVAVAALAATPTFAQTSTSPPANRPATSAPSGAPARATLPSDIKSAKASELIGKNVYSSTDERIGEIDDVVVSKSGGAPMALIGVGGFLGIGEKKAAVSFDQLKVQGDKIVAAGLTKDSLKAQADYKSDDYSKYDRDRVVGEAASGSTTASARAACSSPGSGSPARARWAAARRQPQRRGFRQRQHRHGRCDRRLVLDQPQHRAEQCAGRKLGLVVGALRPRRRRTRSVGNAVRRLLRPGRHLVTDMKDAKPAADF